MTTQASALPIDRLISSGSTSATAPAAGANQQLGATAFLSLLTTELKNQNPLNPVDDTQSVAQLAQFSSLQATTALQQSFSSFQSGFAVSQAAGLLGSTVSAATTDASGNSSTVTGTVGAVSVVNGAPQFTITAAGGKPYVDANGTPVEFTISQITGITK